MIQDSLSISPKSVTVRGPYLLLTIAAVALAAPEASSQPNRFAVTESYDPASPELATYRAGDMVVVNSTLIGGGGLQWSHAVLGLPPFANVDAFSDATDCFPPIGPAIVPPATCRWVAVEYTVDRPTVGPLLQLVNNQVNGNGAASDTFVATFFAGAIFGLLTHGSDALGVTPLPMETDLDALSWLEMVDYPVYFSLDPPSAAALGFHPADILSVGGPGAAPAVFRSRASLGLHFDDDIDALAVLDSGPVVFSLSRTSPTVLPGGAMAAVTPAGLIGFAGAMAPWAFPSQIGLAASTDNLNGVRITDPGDGACWDCSLTDPTEPFPFEALLINGSAGNLPRRVTIPQTGQFTVRPFLPFDVLVLFFAPGIPCVGSCLPINPTLQVAFPPLGPILTLPPLPGPLTLPISGLPPGTVLTVQGLMGRATPPMISTTNAITLIVE